MELPIKSVVSALLCSGHIVVQVTSSQKCICAIDLARVVTELSHIFSEITGFKTETDKSNMYPSSNLLTQFRYFTSTYFYAKSKPC